ncbi:MAG TPA: hypothetical protein VHV08_08945, partial [Pirellulales bacterium]|nr:hypothetical protein [Pirellulales bacterium]
QYVDGYRDTPQLGEIVKRSAQAGESPVVGTFHCFHPSFVFYAGQHVAELDSTANVQQFFAMNPTNAFLLTTQERLDTLASQLPGDVEIIDVRPTFLRSGRTVLLGRTARAGATATKPSPPASSTFE